jgi:hypothetical protein
LAAPNFGRRREGGTKGPFAGAFFVGHRHDFRFRPTGFLQLTQDLENGPSLAVARLAARRDPGVRQSGRRLRGVDARGRIVLIGTPA